MPEPVVPLEVTDLDDLLIRIGRTELDQIAGIGSHNTEDGRSLDEPKIQAAISHTDDLMKGYLAKRYPIINTLEPAQMTNVIKGYASDIVRYRLRLRSGDRNTVTDEVETRYKEAIAWLKDAARGLVNLDFSDIDGGEAATDAATTNLSGSVHASIPPARAPSLLKGYL